MQLYCESMTDYKRLKTREVKIGNLLLGNNHPIRVQTMTTTDTMDTIATVEQTIRCIEAGAELVRITAPSKKEAENLLHIKNELQKRGYNVPLIADIHFTPNAAEIAATIVEKVRVNPGNYVDKKKFEQIDYTDAEYAEEIERIRDRFTPLVKICKEHGTAMRIGTNHGSLSDRIMSRYGDTAMGMVESAMEFLRIARGEDFHNIILSMKSSNPLVMVQAYRLLVSHMTDEFGECYPLHLGVTEAGPLPNGLLKATAGIAALLLEGIGDTIRYSLTADPVEEARAGRQLLEALGLRERKNVDLIACPSCGRAEIDVIDVANRAMKAFGERKIPLQVAVMGCVVNGPGEAREADLGIAAGNKRGHLFVKGRNVAVVPESEMVEALVEWAEYIHEHGAEAAIARVDTAKAEREAAKDRSMLLDAKGDDANNSQERIVEIRKKR